MMRMTLRVTTAAALALAAAVTTGPASATDHRRDTRDSTFLRTIHQGNLWEIAAGQDAQRHAVTRCVKQLGAVFVRDHRRLDRAGALVARSLRIALPGMMTAEQRRMLDEIRRHSGTRSYDREWLKAQTKAHVDTLGLIDQEIGRGNSAKVRAAARSARPIVAHHLSELRGCRA